MHSNVDPLSRMPRIPLHTSPIRDKTVNIVQQEDKRAVAQSAEDRETGAPAIKATFAVWWWEDVVEKHATPIQTRSQYKTSGKELQGQPEMPINSSQTSNNQEENGHLPSATREKLSELKSITTELPFPDSDPWTYPAGSKDQPSSLVDEWNLCSHLLLSTGMDPKLIKVFVNGYEEDHYFKPRYVNEVPNPSSVITPSHF